MSDETQMPVALTVAGFDPSGGAGVVADVKTFTAFGCFAAAAVTSLTFQNTTGVFGAAHQTAETVRAQVEAVAEDFRVAGAKTGMLPTREIIREVARLGRRPFWYEIVTAWSLLSLALFAGLFACGRWAF